MTLPTLTVLLDDGTGSFPYDISKYAQVAPGYTFNRGRADWQGGVTAGVLNIQLDNSDGRFTVGSTKIASPSPIRVDQQIRLRETINGQTTNEYTGYVKSWPVEWPATVATIAMVGITATDAQARAERRPLRSILEEEVLSDSPLAYYTLGEASGAVSSADLSGNQAPLLVTTGAAGASVTYGSETGPVGGGSATGATFAAGRYLAEPPRTDTLSSFTFECFFATTSTSVAIGGLWTIPDTGGSVQWLRVSAAGKLAVSAGVDNVTSAASVNDGNVHHGAFTYNSSSGVVTLYLDGVSQGTANIGAAANVSRRIAVGADLNTGAAFENLTGSVFHVALTGSLLSAARVASHANAGLNSLTGESGVTRLTRIAGYSGLALGSVDASLSNVAAAQFDGSSSQWDNIQQVCDAEFGVAYINGNGTLNFHNRDKVRTKTSPDLSLAATSYITPDVQPVVDDQQIINYAEATAIGTGATQLARSASSEAAHGRYADSQSYSLTTDAEALDRANWIVVNFAEPMARYGTLTINLFRVANENPALAASILSAVDIDCWLRVVNMASQNPTGTTVDVVVQGFTKTRTADSWLLTCNVVLRSLYDALILDNATYGVLDSSVARLGV